MPLRRALLTLLVAALSCGPGAPVDPDWMLGVYSAQSAGHVDHSFGSEARYEIRADGTFVVTGTFEVQFTGGEADLPWRITPCADCNEILVQRITETSSEDAYPIVRGAVCFRTESGCTEGECFCETYWCAEPPPPCGEP